MVDRIAKLDPTLKSYATVMAEQALAAARSAEQEIQAGKYRGPLHGVPIAVKDLCYTKGIRRMGGTPVLRGFVPDVDATVVPRLYDAGAVLLGKLNLTEGAMGGFRRARQSLGPDPVAGCVVERVYVSSHTRKAGTVEVAPRRAVILEGILVLLVRQAVATLPPAALCASDVRAPAPAPAGASARAPALASASAQASASAPEKAGGEKPTRWAFFRTPAGFAVMATVAVGLSYTLYSIHHDRITSPGER